MNNTTHHIKILDDFADNEDGSYFVNEHKSPILREDEVTLHLEVNPLEDPIEEPGFLGFFKKTISNVTKTLQETFKQP